MGVRWPAYASVPVPALRALEVADMAAQLGELALVKVGSDRLDQP
jgi:hypothetical protein